MGPRISWLNLRQKKTRNRGFFSVGFHGCKRRQKILWRKFLKPETVEFQKLFQKFRNFGDVRMFPVTRGANQKMSQAILQFHSFRPPVRGRRIEDEFASTGPWGGYLSTKGGTSSPTSFGCVLTIKRLEEIQFVKEGDNQVYIPRPCVWVFDFRSARSVFVFFLAPL